MDTNSSNSLKGSWKAAFCKVFHPKSGGGWFPLFHIWYMWFAIIAFFLHSFIGRMTVGLFRGCAISSLIETDGSRSSTSPEGKREGRGGSKCDDFPLAGEWHDFQHWHCYTRSSRSISGPKTRLCYPKIFWFGFDVLLFLMTVSHYAVWWILEKNKDTFEGFSGGVFRIASCLFRMLWNFSGVHWEILGGFSSFSHLGHIWRSWPGQLKTSIEIIWSCYPKWMYMRLDELEENITCT